jgi:hypothetical protein
MVDITHSVQVCRDPKDDKFLEVACNGRADAMVTGDGDLLAFHPFRGIPILSPRQFLSYTFNGYNRSPQISHPVNPFTAACPTLQIAQRIALSC